MGVKERATRKISGDGLSLKLRSNEQILEVTGDGCIVTMAKNYGSVKIVGDGCRLRIDQNMGDVEYTGDGGQVLLGPKSIKDKVKYTGDGGRIKFDVEQRVKNRKSKDDAKEETSEGLNRDAKGFDKGKDGFGREEAENTSNARKEAKQAGLDCKEEKKEKLTRTRIVTTFEYDEKIVKKWFANPQAVNRTLVGASFVKIVPKQTKTKIVVK